MAVELELIGVEACAGGAACPLIDGNPGLCPAASVLMCSVSWACMVCCPTSGTPKGSLRPWEVSAGKRTSESPYSDPAAEGGNGILSSSGTSVGV